MSLIRFFPPENEFIELIAKGLDARKAVFLFIFTALRVDQIISAVIILRERRFLRQTI